MVQARPRSRTRLIYHRADWDALVAAARGVSPLQSGAWGEAKARHGWQVYRYAVTTDSALAAAQVLSRATPLGTMFYIPRGPFSVNDANGDLTAELLRAVHASARTLGAVFLKVEPNTSEPGLLPELGFRPAVEMAQPKATLVVDLTPDEAALLARLERGTRYNIGLAKRKGVQVRAAGVAGVDAFYALLQETGRRDGFAIRDAAYYRNVVEAFGADAAVLLAEHEGDLLAGAVLVRTGPEAAYLYGASSNVKRNLKGTQLLQWHCLLRMKAAGCTRYDMWGVPAELAEREARGGEPEEGPEAERGGLWGVYQFKKGFGGELVTFAGAWDYVYRPGRYWVWTRLAPQAKALMRRGWLNAA